MSTKDLVMAAAGTSDTLYVDNVFSTYLYTGNGSTQTITNGINLSTNGGMVWIKLRSGPNAVSNHVLFDTVRGAGRRLYTNTTDAEFNGGNLLTAFTSSGFTIDASIYNDSSNAPVSWTFRKAAKFFDVVTYTGTGVARTIAHSLGSVPGMVIVKQTSAAGQNWVVWHGSAPSGGADSRSVAGYLNLTDAINGKGTYFWSGSFASVTATDTTFGIGSDAATNASGSTYVAYLFAHDTSSTGLIQCGSFTTDANGNATVNLGWEPQWLLLKRADSTGAWYLWDTMRGLPVTASSSNRLSVDTSAAELTGAESIYPTATGFTETGQLNVNATYIYMTIRRPNKPPTSGTQVYNAQTPAPTSANNRVYTGVGFSPDMMFLTHRTGGGFGPWCEDRLRGPKKPLYTYTVNAEDWAGQGPTQGPASFDQDGWTGGSGDSTQWDYATTYTNVFHYFKRAPGFMDVVCFKATGAGGFLAINHNLGVSPNLIIFKNRTTPSYFNDWIVGASVVPNGFADTLALQTTAGLSVSSGDFGTVNSSSFSVYNPAGYSNSYVAYLFATLPGISKVGSYTGNGSSQTINCGFAAGARFILIKRTDSTGDWYVWDSARGILAANDPHLSLNTTAAEVTTDDSIDPDSTGFIVNQLAATNINVTSATYIYLAIA